MKNKSYLSCHTFFKMEIKSSEAFSHFLMHNQLLHLHLGGRRKVISLLRLKNNEEVRKSLESFGSSL